MAQSRATRSSATDTGHERDYVAIAIAYAKAAVADKKQKRHCKMVRQACQRHLDDLKRAKTKDFPYTYSPWHGNDVCDFIEKLPHIEGNWCKCPDAAEGYHDDRCGCIDLEPAQIFILSTVFGWRRKDNGLRRFTMVYEEVARKNAKSTKTAGVSLYCLCCESETGPQILTVATTFDQAKKVFHPAKRMVEKLPALQDAFGIIPWAKSITCGENGGYMQPLHAKSKSQDGHNPHLVTLDEFHAHKDRGLYAIEAKNNPAAEGEFKTKRLNVWTGALSAWLNVTQWTKCGNRELALEDFEGLDCWIGADLSNVDDLSAIVLAAVDGDDRLLIKTWFYVPEARLKSEDTNVKQITELYKRWAADGHVTPTDGDFIDHRKIEDQIRQLKDALAARKATFDQWNSGLAMASRLNEDFGEPDNPFAVQMAKNARNATDPAKKIEARVKAGPHRLCHDDNPVMTWMIGNAVVDRRTDGSLLPKKETANSPNKIDGVDAMINATAPMLLPDDSVDVDDWIASYAA
ncbi:terminase large subunit [Sphingobium sp.]|uniref:terminase large subunit n=1 Tax=Sphingobium sp. TaxID=1912891 RepID=UPI002C48D338|nr:terminase TerL endonuclease subunit [Sphingobium sp.]HUD91223.1 terminase TerL endonuclease subunit [Sphingobium sp.]